MGHLHFPWGVEFAGKIIELFMIDFPANHGADDTRGQRFLYPSKYEFVEECGTLW